jgi:hypothetical protein
MYRVMMPGCGHKYENSDQFDSGKVSIGIDDWEGRD